MTCLRIYDLLFCQKCCKLAVIVVSYFVLLVECPVFDVAVYSACGLVCQNMLNVVIIRIFLVDRPYPGKINLAVMRRSDDAYIA